ncbi:MAG: Gfo/Idh/MocA family oxidoreductase [Sphingopyxis sp.]
MKTIALIGCGGWGKNLARNLNALGVLKYIVDPSPAAAQLAADLGVEHIEEPGAIWCDADITAVVIATPAETHCPLGLAALAAGKHVYVEKPIALSTEDARKLSAAADKAQLQLMVGHLLQYHPVYRALAALTADGQLGALRHIISNRLNLGMVRSEENVMWSFSPHDVSMILGLANGRPTRVRAIGSQFLQSGIHDVVTMHIDFDDGMTAEVRSSWCHPEKEQKLIVVGDTAMAVFDDTAAWEDKLTLTSYTIDRQLPRPKAIRGNVQAINVEKGEPLLLEMQHFIDCVDANERPLTDADEAIAVLAVLQAGQRSLDSEGGWVNV